MLLFGLHSINNVNPSVWEKHIVYKRTIFQYDSWWTLQRLPHYQSMTLLWPATNLRCKVAKPFWKELHSNSQSRENPDMGFKGTEAHSPTSHRYCLHSSHFTQHLIHAQHVMGQSMQSKTGISLSSSPPPPLNI